MAVFTSKYRELSFYVAGERYSFSSGTFSTDDAEVIAVLGIMTDARRIDEPEEESKLEAPKAEQPKEEPKTEDKPKPRKTSGK